MNTNLLKNLGIILIVLGTIMLVISFFCNLVDYNWYNGLAMLVLIGGLITHIIVNKKIID